VSEHAFAVDLVVVRGGGQEGASLPGLLRILVRLPVAYRWPRLNSSTVNGITIRISLRCTILGALSGASCCCLPCF